MSRNVLAQLLQHKPCAGSAGMTPLEDGLDGIRPFLAPGHNASNLMGHVHPLLPVGRGSVNLRPWSFPELAATERR